jgi:hypothetical protein
VLVEFWMGNACQPIQRCLADLAGQVRRYYGRFVFSLWNATPSDPHDDPTIKSVISAFQTDRFSGGSLLSLLAT